MNRKNILKKELETRLPEIIFKLKKGALYNLSIRKVAIMSKEPEWFKKYRKEFETFRDNQIQFNKNQQEFNKNQQEFNKNQQEFNAKLVDRLESINVKVDNIDKRLQRIESLPTIQKEMQL